MQIVCNIPDLLTNYELLSNYNVVQVPNHIIGHTLHTMILTKKRKITVLLVITKLILTVVHEKDF